MNLPIHGFAITDIPTFKLWNPTLGTLDSHEWQCSFPFMGLLSSTFPLQVMEPHIGNPWLPWMGMDISIHGFTIPHSNFQVMELHIVNPWLPRLGMFINSIHGFAIIHIPTSSYGTPQCEPLTPINGNVHFHSWVCDNPHSHFQVMEPHIVNLWLPRMGMFISIHWFVIIHIPTFKLWNPTMWTLDSVVSCM